MSHNTVLDNFFEEVGEAIFVVGPVEGELVDGYLEFQMAEAMELQMIQALRFQMVHAFEVQMVHAFETVAMVQSHRQAISRPLQSAAIGLCEHSPCLYENVLANAQQRNTLQWMCSTLFHATSRAFEHKLVDHMANIVRQAKKVEIGRAKGPQLDKEFGDPQERRLTC